MCVCEGVSDECGCECEGVSDECGCGGGGEAGGGGVTSVEVELIIIRPVQNVL